MPCFKGIAVSIHANGYPIPEYGVQKQSRFSRINTYIPVPQPNLGSDSNKPEPAKFAISITLLTPGIPVPYSTPKATEVNPYPKPQYVGSLQSALSGSSDSRRDGSPKVPAKPAGAIAPYIPMTMSDNETIAAYIYFDGRAKEEVATLLRPGEETWVNSRWVQVPASEGGGLAEREFLFREVGLERWLNGLDLQGHDAAEKLERRRQKFEKRGRRREKERASSAAAPSGRSPAHQGMDLEEGDKKPAAAAGGKAKSKPDAAGGTLRYGPGEGGVEAVEEDLDDDDDSESDSSDDDDDDPPEAAGQIKVAMFRVIASGEIKKGEYSPQFDAHDDDDDLGGKGGSGGAGNGAIDADVEHTTSFAKPKSLDPKTISTQTVTGIDGPDKPYATFTFFYRGERQMQKMGVMPSSKPQASTLAAKRRSGQLDFSKLGPLKTSGTVGFSAFRDTDSNALSSTAAARRRRGGGGARKRSNGDVGAAMEEDSDDDDDDDLILGKMDDDDKDVKPKIIEPEDAKFSGELAEGVNRIRLKRQHSVEPESAGTSSRKSPSAGPGEAGTPDSNQGGGGGGMLGGPGLAIPGSSSLSTPQSAMSAAAFAKNIFPDDSVVGSPLKRHRASIYEGDERAPGGGVGQGAAGGGAGSTLTSALLDVLSEAERRHDDLLRQQQGGADDQAARRAAAMKSLLAGSAMPKDAAAAAAASPLQAAPTPASIDEDEEL